MVIVVDVVEFGAEQGMVRTFFLFEMLRDKYGNVHIWSVEELLH